MSEYYVYCLLDPRKVNFLMKKIGTTTDKIKDL